jgi:hypothetical protein
MGSRSLPSLESQSSKILESRGIPASDVSRTPSAGTRRSSLAWPRRGTAWLRSFGVVTEGYAASFISSYILPPPPRSSVPLAPEPHLLLLLFLPYPRPSCRRWRWSLRRRPTPADTAADAPNDHCWFTIVGIRIEHPPLLAFKSPCCINLFAFVLWNQLPPAPPLRVCLFADLLWQFCPFQPQHLIPFVSGLLREIGTSDSLFLRFAEKE